MKQRILFLSICVFFFTQITLCQIAASEPKGDETVIDQRREISFENDSKPVDITINIDKGVKRFKLDINSEIITGDLSIEIYDPQKTKQGNYSVGTQINSDVKETVHGRISKSLVEPLSGDWIIKIESERATGTVIIDTYISE